MRLSEQSRKRPSVGSLLNLPLLNVSEGTRGLQEPLESLGLGVSVGSVVLRARRAHGGLVECQDGRESGGHLETVGALA